MGAPFRLAALRGIVSVPFDSVFARRYEFALSVEELSRRRRLLSIVAVPLDSV